MPRRRIPKPTKIGPPRLFPSFLVDARFILPPNHPDLLFVELAVADSQTAIMRTVLPQTHKNYVVAVLLLLQALF
jgi:hypothetical protein